MSHYQPTPVPTNTPPGLKEWLARQFRLIANALAAPHVNYLEMGERNEEPQRPQEGMIVFADGSNWNPGSGQGIYAYYGSAWVKLG